ncbi:unnamed protein product [Mytilus edulis]|uniref:CCHC-type domain-containing protein n=1 Tax=Mytilus edulis TaxID=6550 RepID=A0A8S3PZ83_MYTED|nr:unnamed protein product [Mytilus edulis]
MYGERQDNRDEDTRQTPARAYGDRQPQNPYNQGYTPVSPQGVTTGGRYGQQAYPMRIGPGKTQGDLTAEVMGGRYEDHPEVFHEYQVPKVMATMAPERAPGSTWKSELEKTNKKFENKLGQIHEILDDMMDQSRKLLTRPTASYKRMLPLGRSQSRSPSPYRGSGWESVCYHCYKPGHLQNECPDLRSKERSVSFADQTRTTPNPLNSNGEAPEARASPPKIEFGLLTDVQFREQNVGAVTLGYHCPESVCPGKEVMPKKTTRGRRGVTIRV